MRSLEHYYIKKRCGGAPGLVLVRLVRLGLLLFIRFLLRVGGLVLAVVLAEREPPLPLRGLFLGPFIGDAFLRFFFEVALLFFQCFFLRGVEAPRRPVWTSTRESAYLRVDGV